MPGCVAWLPVFVAAAVVLTGCGSDTNGVGVSSARDSSWASQPPAIYPATEGLLLGDLSLNGAMDADDAAALMRIVVGLDPGTCCSDVNHNGRDDLGDALQVLRWASGADTWPREHCGGGGSANLDEALAAPYATSPQTEEPGDPGVELLEIYENDPPEDIAELSQMLAAFTNHVNAYPNSSAGQLGLALAILWTGAENAADELGYALYPDLGVASTAALCLEGDYTPDSMVNQALDLALFSPVGQSPGQVQTAGSIPDTFLTTEEVQRVIKDHLLPVIEAALARLDPLCNAPADTVLITYVYHGDTYHLYPADCNLVAAGLCMARAVLLQLVSYSLDAAAYDWELELFERDANSDGILTVAEYTPADPFLTLLSAADMQQAGAALAEALDRVVTAMENCVTSDPQELAMILLGPTLPADVRDMAQSAAEMLAGPVTVDAQHAHYDFDAGTWYDVGTATFLMQLGRLWSNPAADLKALLPSLTMTYDGAQWHYRFTYDDLPDPTMNGLFPDAAFMYNDLWRADYEYLLISYGAFEIQLNSNYPGWAIPPFP